MQTINKFGNENKARWKERGHKRTFINNVSGQKERTSIKHIESLYIYSIFLFSSIAFGHLKKVKTFHQVHLDFIFKVQEPS